MSIFKCSNCNILFVTKQSLEKHINKKNKCTIKTEFKCTKCNKYFKQKNNLTEHNRKNSCKTLSTNIIQKNSSNNFNDINNIIDSNIDIDSKVKLIKILNNQDEDKIKEILDYNIPIDTKINLLLKNSQVTIINNNNTTNNIQINNFDNEKIDYLTNDIMVKLINTNYGENLFLKLSDDIYLNEKHPENNTIKIDNLTNKYCKIKEKNKWITTTKDSALRKAFLKISDIVETCMADNEDIIPEKKRKIISGYIEKEFEDKIIAETVQKFILNIYNFYTSENIV
jgi:uncharacterized C2H2 Zn-finger protein